MQGDRFKGDSFELTSDMCLVCLAEGKTIKYEDLTLCKKCLKNISDYLEKK